MPSSVLHLLHAAGLSWRSVAAWGTVPALTEPGLYLVSTSETPSAVHGPPTCLLSEARMSELLLVRPEVTVAGSPADLDSLSQALRAMWPEGETVLYVGLAGTSVAHRVRQYFSTAIGARRPHAGGWPIKMLANLDQLHVHVAAADDPGSAEQGALRAFMAGLTDHVRSGLGDPTLPLPYANLELTKGLRKRHTIAGAKEPRTFSAPPPSPSAPSLPVARQSKGSFAMAYMLNVTAADVASGQIRVTAGPKQALALPRVKTTMSITLRGEAMSVTWDPRLGPDKERSGLLRIGKDAAVRLLGGPVNLAVERDDSGLLILR